MAGNDEVLSKDDARNSVVDDRFVARSSLHDSVDTELENGEEIMSSDVVVGSDSRVRVDSDTNPRVRIDWDSDSGIRAYSDSDSKLKIDSDTDPGVKGVSDSDYRVRAGCDRADSDTDFGARVGCDSDPGVRVDCDFNSRVRVGCDPDSGVRGECDCDSGVGVDADSDSRVMDETSNSFAMSEEQDHKAVLGRSDFSDDLWAENSSQVKDPASEGSSSEIEVLSEGPLEQQHFEMEESSSGNKSVPSFGEELGGISQGETFFDKSDELDLQIVQPDINKQTESLSSAEDESTQSHLSQSSFSLSSPVVSKYSQSGTSAATAFSRPPLPSKDRSRYKAYTKSLSDGEDIRWYFCKSLLSPNEVAASIPTTDIVGKGEYLRFSVRDSSSLEEVFLEREEELVSAWWKEFAECSRGPFQAVGRQSTNSSASNRLSVKSVESTGGKVAENGTRVSSVTGASDHSHTLYGRSVSEFDDDETVGVPVKGGLYEVDLLQRRCFPVYWSGDNRRVLRGHWFARKGALDWLPLREDIAEQLEIAYRSQVWRRRSFQPSGVYAARVELQGVTAGLHALFTGEDDTWEASLGVDATGITYFLGLQGNGAKLRRGFAPSGSPQPTHEELRQKKEEEMDDYCSQVPVRHLVFMVHGIGQRLEKANLVDDVGTFRRTVASLAEEHLTSYQRNKQRVLFIPCQWRRHLKLGGESAVENCTLEGVRALRQMISATVHDVLYYMSPVYCQDIIDSVSSSLNRLYHKFVKRNPGYDGKVSIYGHSLGSVLSYDILCHQEGYPFPRDVQTSKPLEVDSTRQEQEEFFLQTPSSHVDNASCLSELETLRARVACLQAKLDSLECSEVTNKDNTKSMNSYENAGDSRSQPVMCGSFKDSTEQSNMDGESKRHTNYGDSKSAGVQKMDKLGPSSMQSTTSNPQPSGNLKTSFVKKRYTPHIHYTKLQFKVDTFFAVGSPLGLFLGLRNVRLATGDGAEYWKDEGIEQEMPACRQMLNIFHPYDPVAYRVEPLVCKEYVGKPPIFIPYHKGGKRLHIGMQEFNEGIATRSKAFAKSLMSVKTQVAKALHLTSKKEEDTENIGEGQTSNITYGSLVIQRLTGSLDGRIDYMLQDATFEHQYISALSSHTSYWQDLDTALFILKHLYQDIPAAPFIATTDVTPTLNIGDSVSVRTRNTENNLEFYFFSKDKFVSALSTVEKSL